MTGDQLPLVSIGVPTYNRADGYFKQALKSALNQTYQNLEIIVADNCSTDNTGDFVNRISDPRIRYFRHDKNIPANDNFNFCLEQARGDYFLLLHDDDLIDDDFIEICMRMADYKSDYGVIRTGVRVIDSQGNVLDESLNRVGDCSLDAYFTGWFEYKTSWYFCNTLYNTKWLKEIGGLTSKYNFTEDGVAIAKLAAKYDRLDILDIKASFRKHGSQTTLATNLKYWCDDFLSLLDLICSLVPVNKPYVRASGERFFSKICYNFAASVQSPTRRYLAYLIVLRAFRYKFLPPPFRKLFFENPFSLKLRKLRRKLLHLDF